VSDDIIEKIDATLEAMERNSKRFDPLGGSVWDEDRVERRGDGMRVRPAGAGIEEGSEQAEVAHPSPWASFTEAAVNPLFELGDRISVSFPGIDGFQVTVASIASDGSIWVQPDEDGSAPIRCRACGNHFRDRNAAGICVACSPPDRVSEAFRQVVLDQGRDPDTIEEYDVPARLLLPSTTLEPGGARSCKERLAPPVDAALDPPKPAWWRRIWRRR
jgi:hypothetical protein